MNFMLFMLLYIAFVFLSVPIHELGHLIFGLMTGYSFSSFRLFNLVWYKENGQIKFKTTKNIFAGQCLMTPASDERKFKFILYNLGGGLLNFISAFLAIIIIIAGGFSVNITEAFVIGDILLAFVTASIIMGLINIVPMNIQVPNDGMNVFKAMQSKDAKRGLYLMLYANSEFMDGKRGRDFNDKIFAVDDSADFNNYFVASIVMHEASRLYDMGEYDKSIEQYARLNINKLQVYYRNNINLDFLYYYIVHKPDFEKAKKIYADKKMQAYLKFNIPPVLRTLAAYEHFVRADKEKGQTLLRKAKREAAGYPNRGISMMESGYCGELEKLI